MLRSACMMKFDTTRPLYQSIQCRGLAPSTSARFAAEAMPCSRSRVTMRSRVRCEVKPTPRELAALRLLAFTLPASRA